MLRLTLKEYLQNRSKYWRQVWRHTEREQREMTIWKSSPTKKACWWNRSSVPERLGREGEGYRSLAKGERWSPSTVMSSVGQCNFLWKWESRASDEASGGKESWRMEKPSYRRKKSSFAEQAMVKEAVRKVMSLCARLGTGGARACWSSSSEAHRDPP
jgi:hypothetical protein